MRWSRGTPRRRSSGRLPRIRPGCRLRVNDHLLPQVRLLALSGTGGWPGGVGSVLKFGCPFIPLAGLVFIVEALVGIDDHLQLLDVFDNPQSPRLGRWWRRAGWFVVPLVRGRNVNRRPSACLG